MQVAQPGTYLQVPEFISPETCRAWAAHVLAHRRQWSDNGTGVSFGIAWYKFIEDGFLHAYHQQAATSNQRIDAVPGFIAAIEDIGRRFLRPKAPVVPRGQYWGKAGFTILSESRGAQAIHADYEGLAPYPAMLFDQRTQAYSLVISVSAPHSGGGLRIFPKRYTADGLVTDRDFDRLIAGKIVPPVDLDYAPGTITLFDSFMYHNIRSTRVTKQPRIVGIAHYLRRGRHWEYWF